MKRRLKALLIAAFLASPAPLLGQSTVLGDTVWVAAPAGAVGRMITVVFADAADRSAMLHNQIELPAVNGRAWRAQDIVVTMDVGTRSHDVTWRLVGPADVIEAFEAEVRKQAERRPSARIAAVRPLVVRSAGKHPPEDARDHDQRAKVAGAQA